MSKRGSYKGFFGFYFRKLISEPSSRILLILGAGILIFGLFEFIAETLSGNPDIQITRAFEAVWWLIVTIASVGYGDYVPKTDLGRFIAIFIIIAGVTFFSIISGSIASILVDIRLKERRGLGKVSVKDHIAIFGWNANLQKIISSLPSFIGNRNFNLVLVNDGTEEDYDELKSHFAGFNIKFVHGDFTKENVMKRANIESAKHIIILADTYGNRSLDEADDRTLHAVLTIKAATPEVKIYAEVVKPDKAKHILRAGADSIIVNGEFTPVLISSSLVSPALPTFIRQLIVSGEEGPKIQMMDIPKSYIGKSFKELYQYFRDKTKGMAVALLTTEKELTIDDLLSSNSSIDAFIRAKFKEAEEGLGEKESKVKINPEDGYVIQDDDTFAFVIQ